MAIMDKDLKFVSNLMKDAYSNTVKMFASKEQAEHADEAIRQAFYAILGEEGLTWKTWRNEQNAIFTIMEEVLAPTLPEAWKTSPFYKRFVEVKNGAIGEKNAFAVKDKTTLVATRFSGGTWDTERQKVGRAKDISIPTEWCYIHVYEELDRFLKGYTSIIEMLDAVRDGFSQDIDNRISTAFNGMGTYLPAAFNETGSYDKDTMATLISRVRTANRCNVVLAGSQTALSKITDAMDSKWISEAAKEEKCTSGMVLRNNGLGVEAVVIPQSFVPYTYDFAVEEDVVYVLPDEQMIKVFYEGDVRGKQTDSQDNHDQTIDIQFQQKVGVGIVTSKLIGKYKLS